MSAAVPPPLSTGQINNTYANIYAIVPVIGLVLEVFLELRGIIQPTGVTGSIVLVYMLVYAVLMQLDFREIAKSGNETVNTNSLRWTLLLAPVYLFVRDKRLGNKQYRLGVTLTGLALVAAVPETGITGMTASLTGTIPGCSTAMVTDAVKRLVDDMPRIQAANIAASQINNVNETSANDIQRMCTGTIVGTDHSNYPVNFKVYLENNQVTVYAHLL